MTYKKMVIPKEIANLLNEMSSWFRWDVNNLWMGTAVFMRLKGRTFDEVYKMEKEKSLIVYKWAAGDKDRQSTIMAYLNPATSFESMPELYEIVEEDDE